MPLPFIDYRKKAEEVRRKMERSGFTMKPVIPEITQPRVVAGEVVNGNGHYKDPALEIRIKQ